jgi:hypothetical protein
MSAKVPFIAQYAEVIPERPVCAFGFDHHRQVGKVLINGCWQDILDTDSTPAVDTRITKVTQETTDDQ